MERLRQWQADGIEDPEKIARALQVAQQAVDNVMDDIQQLDCLHPRATKFMTTMRCIGQLLHADLIGVSSSEPDGFTIDRAVIHLNKDVFDWAALRGGVVYIGTSPILLIDTILCTYYSIAQGARSTSKPTVASCIPMLPIDVPGRRLAPYHRCHTRE